ncbi:dienelactone hydrolase family protein [Streptomyces sp. L2]|uniref:dienelactone hydrolase family protein n=1 Tax=Streptomyces sp. L2 TaxID=2162665 RepID=UPI0010103DC0|nr:dienelactone hydrolase family protein [Streptomyces sp. L2]
MSDAVPVSAGWTRLPEGADAYFAQPSEEVPAATVVVGMELFGVTSWVEKVCRRLAGAGFLAVAPDFYWRRARRAELGYDDAGREAGFRLLGGLSAEGVTADTAAALAAGAERGAGGGRAFVGFSVGGHLGVLAATRLPLDLVVSCYGGWTLDGGIPLAEPEPPLSPAGAAALAGHGTTFLGLVGGQDFLISADEWQRLGQRLDQAGVTHELTAYLHAAHGFLCEDRPETHDPEASKAAWTQILKTLTQLPHHP